MTYQPRTILGSLLPVLKSGTKTTTGCIIQIKNSGLIALSAGAELSVVAAMANP